MIELSYQLQGFDELKQRLAGLADNIGRNALRAGVSAAAKVVRDEARLRAPVRTGTLRRSIYMKQIRELSGVGRQVYYVGARQGKQFQKVGKKGLNQDAYYARFVELGHFTRGPRGMKRSGRAKAVTSGSVHWVPPHPFLRPALESRAQAAIDAMRERMRQRLDSVTYT